MPLTCRSQTRSILSENGENATCKQDGGHGGSRHTRHMPGLGFGRGAACETSHNDGTCSCLSSGRENASSYTEPRDRDCKRLLRNQNARLERIEEASILHLSPTTTAAESEQPEENISGEGDKLWEMNQSLDPTQRGYLYQLLQLYKDIFAQNKTDFSWTNKSSTPSTQVMLHPFTSQ